MDIPIFRKTQSYCRIPCCNLARHFRVGYHSNITSWNTQRLTKIKIWFNVRVLQIASQNTTLMRCLPYESLQSSEHVVQEIMLCHKPINVHHLRVQHWVTYCFTSSQRLRKTTAWPCDTQPLRRLAFSSHSPTTLTYSTFWRTWVPSPAETHSSPSQYIGLLIELAIFTFL